MNNGILLALLAYATYSWSDAAIKALGGELSIFEIGFFLALISGTCIVLTTPKDEHWLDFWRMKRPWAVQARAISGVVASVLGVIAFTTIPLAEVYALIFLAPLFVTILSIFVLKEQVGPWRWFAVVAGFAGVMLVVQPGFRTLEPGHFAALAVALLAAISIILMRSLSGHETRTTMLGYLILYALIVNAIGIAVTGFSRADVAEIGILLIAGVFSATGNSRTAARNTARARQPAGAGTLFTDRLGRPARRVDLRREAGSLVDPRARHHRRVGPADRGARAHPARRRQMEPLRPQPALAA